MSVTTRRRTLVGAAAALAALPACAALALARPEAVPPALLGAPAAPALAPDQLPDGPLESPASATRNAAASPRRDVAQISALAASIPDVALTAYLRAVAVMDASDASCRLSWPLLAAIGHVESRHGQFAGSTLDASGVARPPIVGIRLDGSRGTARIEDTDAGEYDGDRRFDRAVGPMQFIPGTWFLVGVDADGDGGRNPQDIDDAALAAGVYLCSGGEDLSTQSGALAAVLRYNHSHAYARLVLALAQEYADAQAPSYPTEVTALALPDLHPQVVPAAGRRLPEGLGQDHAWDSGSALSPHEAPPGGEEPASEEPGTSEPPVEEPPVEEPPAEEPPAEEPPAEEPPAEEPPAEEPPAEEPPVEEPPVSCEPVEPEPTTPPEGGATGEPTDEATEEPGVGECIEPEPGVEPDAGVEPSAEPALTTEP